jgi:uncharacterized protein YecT (DUF1311 family)
MGFRLFAFGMAALISLSAHAEANINRYTPTYTSCQEMSGGVDPVMLDCIKAEYLVQDAKLRETYRQLKAAMPVAGRSALKATQHDWRRSRKSTCDFHYKLAEGTMAHLVAQSCYLDATVDRVERLVYWNTLRAAVE